MCISGTGSTCVPLANVAQIAAGGDFTCAMTAANVYCWGDNSVGQLGDGAPAGQSLSANPVLVQ